MRATSATIRAVNRMTAHWAADGLAPEALAKGTAFSAAGLWPLLAFLADGACGPARGELEDALGMRADEAAEAARGLLGALARIRGSSAAVGLWVRPGLEVHGQWAAGLPDATLGRFSGDDEADKKALDAWATERTGGLIPAMPLRLDKATLLVLAAAQAVRTKWLSPFQETGLEPDDEGPWAGRDLVGLSRRTSLLDRVGVTETPTGRLTVLHVLGNTGVDVHLLLGEQDAAPGAVLAAGIGILSGTHQVVPGYRLPLGEPGPGLNVRNVRAGDRDHVLSVTTSPFSLTAAHDLLATPALFGLTSATDAGHGHFPGVSDAPLAVQQANQSASAHFTAEGFQSATVTAFGAAAGCAASATPYVVRHIRLVLDRPFGFLTVHRTSRLVLSAGWVAEPVDYAPAERDDEDYDYDDYDDYDEES
ncbi:serpin family protein [Streptomyces sp. NBC_01077]|uniref:serpin family protein n=1 Tax=Streptomyces sp. NBC_01077 TaxID=2903746 RepID=UPI0038704AE5|nr:serpin family protein [Streptomyces sp. NBC_01077]